MSPSVSGPFLYLFSSKNAIFHKFLYCTFWYSINYTYFYFPKWRYKPRMVLKITNLHILRYLPTCRLYLLECYAIDNQRYTHTASASSGRDVLLRWNGDWKFSALALSTLTVGTAWCCVRNRRRTRRIWKSKAKITTLWTGILSKHSINYSH